MSQVQDYDAPILEFRSPNEKEPQPPPPDIVQKESDSDLNHDKEFQTTGTIVDEDPVVTTGADVSRFVVDIRDDGDPSITFRSLFLGTVIAGLGAAVYQVRLPKFTFAVSCSQMHFRFISSNLSKFL